MADTLEASFTLEDAEISQLENYATMPNVDNITTCKCRGRYCCLRESGRNFCPCKSMNTYCSSACHCSRSGACMNNARIQESDSEESDDTTVSFSFGLFL